MTAAVHGYRFPVPCRFAGRSGHVVTEQLRTLDGEPLVRKLGQLTPATMSAVLAMLQRMFAP